MRITQWGEYGVHFCVYIAQEQRKGALAVSAPDIGEDQKVVTEYAQQILQRLRKGGLIESVRGPQGGYKLAKPESEITLYDILLASEGATFEVICETKPINQERCMSGNPCGIRPIWYELQAHVNSFLNRFTLEEIVNKTDKLEAEPNLVAAVGRHSHN